MGIDKTRAFPRSPFRTGIFVVPNKLLLLGVHRNHGEPLSQERLGSFIDVVELFVTIGRWLAFFDEFSVLLKAKSFFFKETSDRARRRDNAFYLQKLNKRVRAFCCPAENVFRVADGVTIEQAE